jgi:carbon monoxide dehydrogenase subunit G
MQITNELDVPLPPDEAWRLLLDVPRMARCMPGATLTEVIDERTYRGTVAVKLGPVRLDFAGEARIEELDEAGRRARVAAKGSDTKGRGNAQAKLVFRLVPAGAGTRVEIETDLQLVGAVAQYGRGVGLIREIANQLVGEFAANLRRELAAATPAPSLAEVAPSEAEPQRVAEPARADAPPQPAAPVAGFRLLFRALGATVAGWIGRLLGRPPEARR